MAAKHRSNPKTQEIRHRVYQIPEDLRKQIQQRRLKRGETVQQFVKATIQGELPRLVKTLRSFGVVSSKTESRPAKLPLDEQLLSALKKASEETGLPQTQLLISCLRVSASRKRRPAVRND